jgi:hypothetical protein
VPYLRNRGGKHNNLVELANPFHELIDAGPFDDIDIMIIALNLDGYCEVGLVKDLETVSEGLTRLRWRLRLTLKEL